MVIVHRSRDNLTKGANGDDVSCQFPFDRFGARDKFYTVLRVPRIDIYFNI